MSVHPDPTIERELALDEIDALTEDWLIAKENGQELSGIEQKIAAATRRANTER